VVCAVLESSSPSPDTPWRRRNRAEFNIRESIAGDRRLRVFASGFAPGRDELEVVVMITAEDEAAKDAARDLLGETVQADWELGWRSLQLGDYLLRLYPER
jgi:hypothetical protein